MGSSESSSEVTLATTLSESEVSPVVLLTLVYCFGKEDFGEFPDFELLLSLPLGCDFRAFFLSSRNSQIMFFPSFICVRRLNAPAGIVKSSRFVLLC